MMDYLYYNPVIERGDDEQRRLDAALQTLRASGYTPGDPEAAEGGWWLSRIEATLERLCDDDVFDSASTLEEIWNKDPSEKVKEAVMTLLVTGLRMKKGWLE
jgi:hypothetical protein